MRLRNCINEISMENKCLRVLADQNQIDECRNEIEEVATSVSSISKMLNLAGNEVRLKIMYLLYREGEMCPCDLSDVLGMSVPAISQHLRKMKDGAVVTDKKIGQTIFYSLIKDKVSLLIPLLEEIKGSNTSASPVSKLTIEN